jgi:S-adenosylmethionine hydrolase
LITLTTDFGTIDSYVAEMKGVILQLNPAAVIVDVSHCIEPQGVAQGPFVLGSVYHSFPKDTVHVAVVDPGWGRHV